MEKITYLPNGQWQLEKAKPSNFEEAHHYNKVDNLFTGKDLADQQNHALNMAKQHSKHAVKQMPNENGELEDHILLHRGIRYMPKDNGPHEDILVSPTHVEGKDYSVHTLYNDVAHEYTKKADGSNGKVLSFWVPISKVRSMGEKIREHLYNNKYDYKQHFDDHSEIQKHTSVYPGKFKRATPEEVELVNSTGKTADNIADKIKEEHWPDQHLKDQNHKEIMAVREDPRLKAMEWEAHMAFGKPEHRQLRDKWLSEVSNELIRRKKAKALKQRSKKHKE